MKVLPSGSVRAIGLGLVLVVTDAAIRWISWTSSNLYWGEFALLVATVLGIGGVVGGADGTRPFLKATVVSFVAIMCLEYVELFTGPVWARPPVLPPPGYLLLFTVPVSLMIAMITGAVALGVRAVRARRKAAL